MEFLLLYHSGLKCIVHSAHTVTYSHIYRFEYLSLIRLFLSLYAPCQIGHGMVDGGILGTLLHGYTFSHSIEVNGIEAKQK